MIILAFHHGPEAVAAMQRRLDDERIDVRVFGLVSAHGALSSAYHTEAAHRRRAGRILPSLALAMGFTSDVDQEDILLASWSAGYALVQDIFATPADVSRVVGWLALDSGYGPVTPGELELARRARAGEKLFFSSYTDVPTSGYFSTGKHLALIQERVGSADDLFDVEHLAHSPDAYRAARDKAAFWRAEHTAALHRGPERLVAALRALAARQAAVPC